MIMAQALALLRRMISMRVCCNLLLCALIVFDLPHLEAREEGDSCVVKENLPGVCKTSSKCEPLIDKYIKTGRLTVNEVPSCGLGTREEIVCCPIAECCDDDKRPSQVQSTKATTTTTTKATTTTSKSIISMENEPRSSNPNLDLDSDYFDFQQLLNNPQKQQSQPQSQTQFRIQPKPQSRIIPNANVQQNWQGSEQFQSVGPWGQPPTQLREPKIINKPQSLRPQQRPLPGFGSRPAIGIAPAPQKQDLIQLVNNNLRQQGLNIVPATQVTTFQVQREPMWTSSTPSIDLDPWAPFRFRKEPIGEIVTNELDNYDAAEFGPETTTSRTIQPTPTTRVDVPQGDRPAMRACRLIEERQKEEALTVHILDGIPVESGVYPHMAAIAFSNFGSFVYRCGGSLISSRYVLTAAHCVNSESNFPVHVRLGSVNIAEVNSHYQDIAVTENIVIHPEYVSSSKYNDIAILELAEQARLSFYIYPACLETNIVDPPETAQVFVAGWGTMNQTTRRTSKILLRAPLNVVPLQQCNESFAEQPNSKRFLKEGVNSLLLCAADRKNNKADACQGDSGGPLILERDIVNNQYSILGVISSGFGCATKTPGLYTRVAHYLDFIEKVVWPDNVVN